jgi:NAD(P)-dependent dehydrogenase (short-subunit alcohol dehydrogenase family)
MPFGPTVLLTGPTRGLGRATCEALVRTTPGLRLVLLGRPGPLLTEVAAEAVAGGARVEVVPVDLASLASVRTGAAAVRDLVAAGAVGPLDALIANAGIQTGDATGRTADGIELTFGVNVVAQHLLVRELLEVLAPGGHVVLLGSGTHSTDRSARLVAHPRWADPAELARPGRETDAALPVAGQRAYATSKLAVVHLCHELARRCPQRRFTVYDPGLMPGTGLARDMGPLRRFAWHRVMPYLPLPGTSTPARSGAVLADLALGRVLPQVRGGYVDVDRETPSSPESHDPAREARLWEVCEALTAPASA